MLPARPPFAGTLAQITREMSLASSAEDTQAFHAWCARYSNSCSAIVSMLRTMSKTTVGRQLLTEIGVSASIFPASALPTSRSAGPMSSAASDAALAMREMCGTCLSPDCTLGDAACQQVQDLNAERKLEKKRKRARKINGVYVVPELLRSLVESYGGYVACFGDGRHAATSKWNTIVKQMGIPVKKRMRNGRLVDKGKEAAALRKLYCLWFPADIANVPEKYKRLPK